MMTRKAKYSKAREAVRATTTRSPTGCIGSLPAASGFTEDFSRVILRDCARVLGPPGTDSPGTQPHARLAAGHFVLPAPNFQKQHRMEQSHEISGRENKKQTENPTNPQIELGRFIMKYSIDHRWTFRAVSAAAIAIGIAMGAVSPALADITNTATVNGTFNAATITDTSGPVNIPVTAPVRDLDIAKSVFTVASQNLGSNSSATDGGDTIIYRYTVTNPGNITETNIVVDDSVPTFDGVAGTGSFISDPTVVSGSAASLAPGDTVIFESTYELTDADAYRAATAIDPTISVASSATANSDNYTMPGIDAAIVTTGVIPVASVAIAKNYSFQSDPSGNLTADVGDEILYSYQITNTGNVPVTEVYISDSHENGEAGAATFDSSGFAGPLGTAPGSWDIAVTTPDVLGVNLDDGADGSFERLGAGGVITFTYAHAVTQAEFDAQ